MPGPRFDTRQAAVWLALLCVPPQSSRGADAPPPTGGLTAKGGLEYSVEWRLVDAGSAKLNWSAGSRPGWHIGLHLESAGLVSKLYKVNDDYSTDLSADLCVQDTHLTAHEGSRQRDVAVHYDPETKKASYLEHDLVTHAVALAKETDIPPCVHDIVGGLFFLRTLNIEPGRSVEVPVSDGKKSVSVKVEAQQREQIKVPAGTFKTVRYEA